MPKTFAEWISKICQLVTVATGCWAAFSSEPLMVWLGKRGIAMTSGAVSAAALIAVAGAIFYIAYYWKPRRRKITRPLFAAIVTVFVLIVVVGSQRKVNLESQAKIYSLARDGVALTNSIGALSNDFLKLSIQHRDLSNELAKVSTPIKNRAMLLGEVFRWRSSLKSLKPATQEELEASVITDRIVFVSDIPVGPNTRFAIEGKRFIGCVLIGPVILGIDPNTMVYENEILANPVDSVLYDKPPGPRIAVMGIRASSFTKCVFHEVGFMGPKEILDKIRGNTI